MGCTMCNVLLGLVGFVALTLVLGWWMNGYFRRRGVKSSPTYIPFIGHMLPAIMRTQHFKDLITEAYTKHPEEKYSGFIQFTRPLVVVRDIELLKQIAIKDFDHFLDHVTSVDGDVDALFGNSLFSLKGQKWRDMRATLSPAFTSAKMRGMFQYIVDCGEQMANYYMKQSNTTENKVRGLVEVEMKDAFTRYANDIIATSAFGLEVDSFTNTNNQFYMMGKEATNFTGIRFLLFFVMLNLPRVAKFFSIQLFNEKVRSFFRNLIWDTIHDREKRNIYRNDMIQLLMEARKGTLKHEGPEDVKDAGFATVEESSVGKTTVKRVWSDDDIVAQAVLFFIAGFDTASTLLCFLAHELALHPEIQKKLQAEIDEVAAASKGKLTYDIVQKMKYMDMVVSEALRLWPPVVVVDRKCVKPYTLPPPHKNGKNFHLRQNDGVWFPIFGFHRDPKYFKNPEAFDPERFSDENKDNIKPFTYLPFGVGPRNCIGSRFALMEAKAVVYNLLLKFDIVTTAKTQHPIQLRLDSFNMHARNGFWVGLKPRTTK